MLLFRVFRAYNSPIAAPTIANAKERCSMRKLIALGLATGLLTTNLVAQSSPSPQQQPPSTSPQQRQEDQSQDILRITTELVQTDVVVVDKNDQIISDLKLGDFEVFDNGKKQDLQLMEFISVDEPGRSEGSTNIARVAPGIDTSVPTDPTAADLRRVIGFVVDDVTIPSEDMARVRTMLLDFVDNKMRNGDLVAIVRTVGGRGLLEQFTTDRQILRRAVHELGVRSIPPHLAFTGDEPGRISSTPSPFGDATAAASVTSLPGNEEFEGPSEGANQIPRSMLGLMVSNQVVNSLKQIPGRKNLVLLSGGLPLFDETRTGGIIGDVTQLFRQLTDNATRSGVVINTMDVRGLKTTGAVAAFRDTPAKSALGGGTFAGSDENPNFGRGMDTARLGDRPLSEQLTLRILASMTGGVSVVNSNNFTGGLEKVLQRSRGYYRLAYRPSEKFDNKFHKVDVKVHRSGVQLYFGEGYVARQDRGGASATKEDQIMKAAASPLARRDLDVAAELQYVFSNTNQADLTINAFINARKLDFKKVGDRYRASLDVVGFVFDQLGKSRGGISQTVNPDLTEENYRRALATGLSYTASTRLPPGYYQVRLVLRETESGKMGTVSRYFEVPDLSQKQLTMSSVLLYQINPVATEAEDKTPQQLPATRVISRKNDLRYATVVYNAKMDGGKPQVTSRLIISAGGKVLFQEPEQPVTSLGKESGQLVRVGQLALAKVPPGRYVLTLVVKDPLADKKRQTISRSVDFTVVD
jgi:VWFA-related protein